MRPVFRLAFVVLGLGFLIVAGCSRQDGPPRYRVTGTITYDGQPVPQGSILFLPDSSKGNDGPGGSAKIVDGKFDTKTGQSPIGGPHRVMIEGFRENFDPLRLPQPLFRSYTTVHDLPKADTRIDIQVPKGGGSGI